MEAERATVLKARARNRPMRRGHECVATEVGEENSIDARSALRSPQFVQRCMGDNRSRRWPTMLAHRCLMASRESQRLDRQSSIVVVHRRRRRNVSTAAAVSVTIPTPPWVPSWSTWDGVLLSGLICGSLLGRLVVHSVIFHLLLSANRHRSGLCALRVKLRGSRLPHSDCHFSTRHCRQTCP